MVVKEDIAKRVLMAARHILDTQDTIRKTANLFGVSKSTIHIDISKRLPLLSDSLFQEVKAICDLHFEQKHILGGLATQKKSKQKKCKADNG